MADYTPWPQGESSMKPHYEFALAMLGGFALGAATLEGICAQAKPPAYVISEIEVTNADAYAKEYVPLANKALAESGHKRPCIWRQDCGARRPATSGAHRRIDVRQFGSADGLHLAGLPRGPSYWRPIWQAENLRSRRNCAVGGGVCYLMPEACAPSPRQSGEREGITPRSCVPTAAPRRCRRPRGWRRASATRPAQSPIRGW